MSHPWQLLETPRLRLRPYEPADVGALHAIFTNPEVRRHLLDDEVVPRSWVEEEIRTTTQLFASSGYGQWGIELSGPPDPSNRLIGFAGFRPFFEPPELQLLYGLLPDFWGHGYARESSRAVIEYGFNVAGMDVIRAATDTPNRSSIAVLESLGMTFVRRENEEGNETLFYEIRRDDPRPNPD